MSPQQALAEMQGYAKLAEENAEGPHSEADYLLIQIIRHLSVNSPDNEVWEQVLVTFENMTRWYA